MPEPLFIIKDLARSFGATEVLRSVNLEINRGESIVIIGQSGCGKSVLLKHLIGLLGQDSGTVIFDGQNLAEITRSSMVKIRRRIGMLFQSAALFDSMTVAENVGLGLKESGDYSRDEIAGLVEEKLKLVGLSSAAEKFPSELSGGMRKRAGLARAIATNPEVILYDEPTTGLDPITADMINELIIELSQKLKVTSVSVTHDMTSAYKIADRIVMLYEGMVEFAGTPDEIRNSDRPVVKQFINGLAQGPIQVR